MCQKETRAYVAELHYTTTAIYIRRRSSRKKGRLDRGSIQRERWTRSELPGGYSRWVAARLRPCATNAVVGSQMQMRLQLYAQAPSPDVHISQCPTSPVATVVAWCIAPRLVKLARGNRIVSYAWGRCRAWKRRWLGTQGAYPHPSPKLNPPSPDCTMPI